MAYNLAQLAELTGASLQGEGSVEIVQVASAENAKTGHITFVTQARYLEQALRSSASAIIVSEEDAAAVSVPALIHRNPYLIYAKVSQLLNPRTTAYEGVHPTAWIHPEAALAADVCVGPGSVVGARSRIGKGVVLGPGVVIEEDVTLGSQCWLGANVTVCAQTQMGDRVAVQPGAVIGSDGFGYANEDGHWVRIPQIGRVIIGNDVEIGANTTIDRGAMDDTIIADGVVLDNLIQVAHNCSIGENTAVAAMTGMAGSSTIGAGCTIGGMAKITGHLEIAPGTHLAADTLVSGDIKQAGAYAGSVPMDSMDKWRKNAVRFKQLDDMAKRLRKLEKLIEKGVNE